MPKPASQDSARQAAIANNPNVPRDTLIDFFRDLSAIRAEFLVYDDGYRRRRHSYEDVARAARGFARKLSAAGLKKDDKVVFWGENRPEWIVCYWGCLISGIIVVPIDYRSSAEFVEKVRRLVDARIVLAGDDVPMGDAASHASGVEWWRFADVDWQADGPMPAVPASRDDVIQIIFTSGATAEPKGRRHPAPERAREHRPGGAGNREIPPICAAVSPAALPEPAAAEPHVRPVDGDEHSADGARHGHLHAQLQPARPPAPDSRAARVGAGLRAEDPRRAARARRAHLPGIRRGRRRRASPFPGAGGATAGCTPRSA